MEELSFLMINFPLLMVLRGARRCKTNFENMRAHGGQQVTGIYSASWGGNAASHALSGAIAAAGVGGNSPHTMLVAGPLPGVFKVFFALPQLFSFITQSSPTACASKLGLVHDEERAHCLRDNTKTCELRFCVSVAFC